MVKFFLSIVIATLLVTYAIIPLMKYIKKFFRKEGYRIERSFIEKEIKTEKDDVE